MIFNVPLLLVSIYIIHCRFPRLDIKQLTVNTGDI